MSRSIAVALALAGWLTATEARGQHFFRGKHAAPAVGYSSGYAGVASPATSAATSNRVYPYSYYVAYPGPARGYVGYGAGDTFVFHGQPYGHPYDPWTWPYLEGSYRGTLARYYDPPVK